MLTGEHGPAFSGHTSTSSPSSVRQHILPAPMEPPWLPGHRLPALGDNTCLLAPPGVYLLGCPNRGKEHGILEGVPLTMPLLGLTLKCQSGCCHPYAAIGGGTQRTPPDNRPGRCQSGLISRRGPTQRFHPHPVSALFPRCVHSHGLIREGLCTSRGPPAACA